MKNIFTDEQPYVFCLFHTGWETWKKNRSSDLKDIIKGK